MSSNQKKIRDVERMIKKYGSSPELLAKLEDAKLGKDRVQVKERTRKNATKYHMVRFLERKKVTRKVRSIETKLKKADADDTVDLNKKRDNLLNDLAYIMYYPMEYKYIALFPGKDDKQSDSENEDGANMSEQKTKLISKKARELALQRWEEDKQRLAEGVEGGGDKVAYAMEVEYKGGAAAAESNPGKAPTKDPQQVDSRFDKANKAGAAIKTVTTKAGSKHTTFGTEATTAIEKAAATTLSKTQTSSDIADPSDSESSSDSGSDDESSDSGDRSDSDSEQVSSEADSDSESKGKTKATITTTKKVENTKQPASWAVPSAPEAEESDNDKDDFFVEEAPESELANLSATPKVYNDGNNFRFKEERKSVHEIRFAATKRKYERHKRVFNNQNKRGASDRKKQRN